MIYIENLLNISHLKKIQIHLQVLLLLKNTCYNVLKVFLSIIYKTKHWLQLLVYMN